jgi:hypothetical protein
VVQKDAFLRRANIKKKDLLTANLKEPLLSTKMLDKKSRENFTKPFHEKNWLQQKLSLFNFFVKRNQLKG